jgi:hypothetical protein
VLRSSALVALTAGLLLGGCSLAGASVQDAAPRYRAASDGYQGAITQAALSIQTTSPDAATVAGAMGSMERATRKFLADVHQISFPDGMQAHVSTMESDSQSLADQDHLLFNEAGHLPRADVARWNQLDSAWRSDDKQLRQDLGLPIPDFDNH